MTREITVGGLLTGGFTSTATFPNAPPLYQRRHGGTIWYYTGTPCKDGSCPGWRPIGSDPLTVSILASGTELYKRHSNAIWRCKDAPAKGGSCSGWEKLDNHPTAEIAAAGIGVATGDERHFEQTELYQRRNDGVWRYTGTPCSNDTSCPGWELLDDNPGILEITAGKYGTQPVLYQRRAGGAILRHKGASCKGTSCWELLDSNTSTISIVASGDKFYKLYKLHDDGAIWAYAGPPCSGESCWHLLDENPLTRQIAVGPASVYKRHDNGAIWRYTGPPCNEGSCWQLLDHPPMRTMFTSRN